MCSAVACQNTIENRALLSLTLIHAHNFYFVVCDALFGTRFFSYSPVLSMHFSDNTVNMNNISSVNSNSNEKNCMKQLRMRTNDVST